MITVGASLVHRREPYFIEDSYAMGLDHYYIPEHYRDTLDNILINHGTIVDRVEKLAYDITQDYNGQTIHILCVLKGNLLLHTQLSPGRLLITMSISTYMICIYRWINILW